MSAGASPPPHQHAIFGSQSKEDSGDGQYHVIRLVPPQDMFTGVGTQRAIRNGDHHDWERVGEQAQRRGLAIRERDDAAGRPNARKPPNKVLYNISGSRYGSCAHAP